MEHPVLCHYRWPAYIVVWHQAFGMMPNMVDFAYVTEVQLVITSSLAHLQPIDWSSLAW